MLNYDARQMHILYTTYLRQFLSLSLTIVFLLLRNYVLRIIIIIIIFVAEYL